MWECLFMAHRVAMHRLDNTQLGSIAVAEDKARTSVLYRRPWKAFEDATASGGIGLRVLGLRGAGMKVAYLSS